MQLVFYDRSYHDLIEQYQITEQQLKFTGAPIESNRLTELDSDRYAILAIQEGNLVTYFNLHKNEGVKPFADNPSAILLRAFSTDNRYRGKGYAKEVLKLLPSFIKEHFKEIDEIVLAVNKENDVAQKLYVKCGFIDHGERRMGKKGELIIMSCSL
ncbi:GNAT family N-acetyltransferase [Lysinibacillus yapensis]|uniref:GNAT family N-acetyltransferase n=1 Tax=Ureibacillus yapensis TaxID=2304605 RepID=A0A396SEP5_9BACL|nr:GNAT family N-acetyltransferase [Lysinibacillus yapensis]RHW40203.1 GNAT family N-acetyltransferase [Lysinibacillus yapensis]